MKKILSFGVRTAGRVLLLLSMMAACVKTPCGDCDREVAFSVTGAGVGSAQDDLAARSVLSASAEDRISSVFLLFYKDGKLEKTASFTGASGRVAFSDDGERTVYALVNMSSIGEKDVPPLESGLADLVWRIPSYASMEQDGLPMAESMTFRPSGQRCEIKVRRLVSRFSFSLTDSYRSFFDESEWASEYDSDPSFLLKDMTYTLKNINGALRPFGTSVAETPSDLLSDREFELTADGTAVLYVPENLLGDLLDIDDPAEKTMDALQKRYGQDKLPCATYVEVTLLLDPSVLGIGGNLTYRFFLGENNTTNFSVGRNMHYKVYFGPEYDTVKGCLDTGSWTWKIESDNWRDSRYLYLDREIYTVSRGGRVVIVVVYGYENTHHPERGDTGDLSSPGCDWRAYVKHVGQEDGALKHCSIHESIRSVESDLVAGTLTFEMENTNISGSEYEIVVRTRDGKLTSHALLHVVSGSDYF